MAGFLDFLLGNMLNTGGAQGATANPLAGAGVGATGSQMPMQAPQAPQINPLENLFKNFMTPPQQQGQGAGSQNSGMASTNPETLGVGVDQSNPMKNDSMRRMMIMQYLSKMQGQQGQQQQQAPSMTPSMGSGGAMASRGGAGMSMPSPSAQLVSMPYPTMKRPQFIGSMG